MNTKINNQTFTYLLESDSFIANGIKDFIYEIKESDISMNDLILSESSRDKLTQVIEEYRNKDKLKMFNGLKPIHKIILNGDSGCGKTTSALAIANELKRGIIIVNLSEIISSRLGETSKNLSKVLKYAENNGYIIFFDEFDSISKHRSDDKELGEMKRLVNSLIQLLDFSGENILIIGATNNLESIDSAIIRRFEEIISFEKPSENDIIKYLQLLEFNFEGKVKINISKSLVKQFLGHDFFKIKTIINNSIKRKILKSNTSKVSLSSKDLIF